MCLLGLYYVYPRPKRREPVEWAVWVCRRSAKQSIGFWGNRADERARWDFDSNAVWSAESITYCAILSGQCTRDHCEYDSCPNLIEDRSRDVCR